MMNLVVLVANLKGEGERRRRRKGISMNRVASATLLLATVTLITFSAALETLTTTSNEKDSDWVNVTACVNGEGSCTKNCTSYLMQPDTCFDDSIIAITFQCSVQEMFSVWLFNGDQCSTKYQSIAVTQRCNHCSDYSPFQLLQCTEDTATASMCDGCDGPDAGKNCKQTFSVPLDTCSQIPNQFGQPVSKNASVLSPPKFDNISTPMWAEFPFISCEKNTSNLHWHSYHQALGCYLGFGDEIMFTLECVAPPPSSAQDTAGFEVAHPSTKVVRDPSDIPAEILHSLKKSNSVVPKKESSMK